MVDMGGLTSTKRLTDIHSLGQIKAMGGQSVKNYSTQYKNPFFSAAMKHGNSKFVNEQTSVTPLTTTNAHTLELVNVKG